jgi:hypothetical protein
MMNNDDFELVFFPGVCNSVDQWYIKFKRKLIKRKKEREGGRELTHRTETVRSITVSNYCRGIAYVKKYYIFNNY